MMVITRFLGPVRGRSAFKLVTSRVSRTGRAQDLGTVLTSRKTKPLRRYERTALNVAGTNTLSGP